MLKLKKCLIRRTNPRASCKKKTRILQKREPFFFRPTFFWELRTLTIQKKVCPPPKNGTSIVARFHSIIQTTKTMGKYLIIRPHKTTQPLKNHWTIQPAHDGPTGHPTIQIIIPHLTAQSRLRRTTIARRPLEYVHCPDLRRRIERASIPGAALRPEPG